MSELRLSKSQQAELDANLSAFCKARSMHSASLLLMAAKLKACHDILAGAGRDGQFRPWVEENCHIGVSAAYALLRIHDRWYEHRKLADHFDDSAIRYLSSEPQNDFDLVIERVKETGDFITLDTARSIIHELRPVETAETSVRAAHTSGAGEQDTAAGNGSRPSRGEANGRTRSEVPPAGGSVETPAQGLCGCDNLDEHEYPGPSAPEPERAGTRFLRRLDEPPVLPDDLAEAVEALKLAVIRHRSAHWDVVSPESVAAWCDWLKWFALLPAEKEAVA